MPNQWFEAEIFWKSGQGDKLIEIVQYVGEHGGQGPD